MLHNLWVYNASQTMKERMPYVVDGSDSPKWATNSEMSLGDANGRGGTGAMGGGGYKYIVENKERRADRIAATVLYTNGINGIFRPTTPELRLKDHTARNHVGLLGAGFCMKDWKATAELFRICNDWLAHFCSYDHKRFVGLASIPSYSVEAAVAETERVANRGLGGLDFATFYVSDGLHIRAFSKSRARTGIPLLGRKFL